MLLRRDPNLADVPETGQNGGFRREFAKSRDFASFPLSSCGPRPKGPFAPNGWPQNAAGTKHSIAPQWHFFCLETGTYGHRSVCAGALNAQIGAQTPQLGGPQAPGPL